MSHPLPHVQQRRQKVLGLLLDGHTGVSIAREVGASLATINNDIAELRAQGHEIGDRRGTPRNWGEIQAKWNHGLSAPDIARALGMSADTVRHAMQKMRERGFDLYTERDPLRCGGIELRAVSDDDMAAA